MSFVILLIHPVLVTGRVSLPRGLGRWEPCPHSMSVCQYEKALLARRDSKQGNDQSRVMIWQRKGKTMRRKKEDAGWPGWWDGEHGCGWGQPPASCISCAGFPALWHQSFKQCKISGVFAMLEEPGQLKILRISNPRLPTPGEEPHSKGWKLRQCPLARGLVTRILLSSGTTKVLLSFGFYGLSRL